MIEGFREAKHEGNRLEKRKKGKEIEKKLVIEKRNRKWGNSIAERVIFWCKNRVRMSLERESWYYIIDIPSRVCSPPLSHSFSLTFSKSLYIYLSLSPSPFGLSEISDISLFNLGLAPNLEVFHCKSRQEGRPEKVCKIGGRTINKSERTGKMYTWGGHEDFKEIFPKNHVLKHGVSVGKISSEILKERVWNNQVLGESQMKSHGQGKVLEKR